MCSRARSKRFRGVTAAFLGFGLLAVAEEGLRWASYARTYHYHEVEDVYWEDQNTLLLYLPDPMVFWRLRPGIRLKATVAGAEDWLHPEPPRRYTWEIAVSSRGFRSGDFPAQKSPSELRVVCFGDSRTLGEGLQEGETYPSRLQRVLENRFPGRRVRVINLGQDGWSSHQGVKLLEREIVNDAPDVATFAFGVNDTDTDWGLPDKARDAAMNTPYVAAQRILYKSLLFYWAQKELLQARGWLFGKTRIPLRREGPWSPERARVPLRDYSENVHRFVRVCRSHGILPVVIALPVNPYRDWGAWTSDASAKPGKSARESYGAHFGLGENLRDRGRFPEAHRHFEEALDLTAFARYERAAVQAALEESAPVVSLDDPFRAMLPFEPLYLDEVHLNPNGAALVGDFLADRLATLAPAPASVMASSASIGP
ncbi:MAG TPA: GDSL-type esterase/lipase family protein [Vicinamibacteria bacterium]|nr:GDSL-type esterase/lipase family protein [Vicinamibacteria bacterium]